MKKIKRTPFFVGSLLLFILIAYACNKDMTGTPANEFAKVKTDNNGSPAFALNSYTGLSSTTLRELQQARVATAKYKHIENAIADGYQDIHVDVDNMGHHYMKVSLVNGTFDISHPQILVYNKDARGVEQLVAVEYAVPLSDPQPQGFTGDADVWDGNTGFGLWLLHAWVWDYNPNGVFSTLNPNVQLN
ncbi:MAG TPA: hypothetical protein VFT78_09015 [Hanamia sp.]|nr:hypothetical protein [Hanamia sp.]